MVFPGAVAHARMRVDEQTIADDEGVGSRVGRALQASKRQLIHMHREQSVTEQVPSVD